jgi:hypothetical protein
VRAHRIVVLTVMLVVGSAAYASGQRLPRIQRPQRQGGYSTDTTVFIGGVAPAGRGLRGATLGWGQDVIRGELEVWDTGGGASLSRPGHGGLSGGILIQSRPNERGLQYFGTAGFGLYFEDFGSGFSSGEAEAKYLGVGIKLRLAGPLRLRAEYRAFLLGEAPDASPEADLETFPHRLTVGLTLQF